MPLEFVSRAVLTTRSRQPGVAAGQSSCGESAFRCTVDVVDFKTLVPKQVRYLMNNFPIVYILQHQYLGWRRLRKNINILFSFFNFFLLIF